jgi:hypothetical protein
MLTSERYGHDYMRGWEEIKKKRGFREWILYQAERGGNLPDATKVVAQLTQYPAATGAASASKDATHLYGPYLRRVPPLPVGARKGQTGIAAADGATIGWIYNATAGMIQTNTTTETDSAGNLLHLLRRRPGVPAVEDPRAAARRLAVSIRRKAVREHSRPSRGSVGRQAARPTRPGAPGHVIAAGGVG